MWNRLAAATSPRFPAWTRGLSKGVSDGSRTHASWFTARRAATATPRKPCELQQLNQESNPDLLVRSEE